MPYDPRESQGSQLQYSTSAGGTYALIPGVRAPKQGNSQAAVVELTAVSDTSKRQRSGLKDPGTWTCQLVYDPNDTVHQALETAFNAGTKLYFRYNMNASAPFRKAFAGTIRKFEYTTDNDSPHLMDMETLIDGGITTESYTP